MPEISRFFGIIIRMFAEPAGPHHRPHFHAYYQNVAAVFAIDSLEILGGELPHGSDALWRPGPRSTEPNCSRTGTGCRVVRHRSRSILFSKLVLTS